jgi:hypothetical protein
MFKTLQFISRIFVGFTFIFSGFVKAVDPVSDCGCFGDAIILTNWQTFWKNIVIFTFAAIVFFSRNGLSSPYSRGRQTIFSFFLIVYITGIAMYSIRHLPLIDFRPFAVGKHIPSGMTIPEDAPQPKYNTTFILEKDGKQQEFTEDNYPYEDTTWVFIDSKTKVISEGYQPPIHDFVLQHPEDGNITDQLMEISTPLFLVISPAITKIKSAEALKIAELHQTALEKNYPYYLVTSSSLEETRQFNNTHKTHLEFLQGDDTNLKTIIRSNPGLLLIINGTVAGKWHYSDLPTAEQLKNPLSYSLQNEQSTKKRMMLLGHAVMIALLAMLILNTRKTINKKNQ